MGLHLAHSCDEMRSWTYGPTVLLAFVHGTDVAVGLCLDMIFLVHFALNSMRDHGCHPLNERSRHGRVGRSFELKKRFMYA